MKLFVATKNQGKLREIKKTLQDMPIEIYSLIDFHKNFDVIEDKETFEGNAIKKATEVAKIVNMITLADDSGLCVDALNGKPGVHSARFSGEEKNYAKNNEKLLKLMKNVIWKDRTARFVCVMCLAEPTGEYELAKGECEGIITKELRGTNGFGYDPLFYIPKYDKTFGELPSEVKNQISHRALALRKMRVIIENYYLK